MQTCTKCANAVPGTDFQLWEAGPLAGMPRRASGLLVSVLISMLLGRGSGKRPVGRRPPISCRYRSVLGMPSGDPACPESQLCLCLLRYKEGLR